MTPPPPQLPPDESLALALRHREAIKLRTERQLDAYEALALVVAPPPKLRWASLVAARERLAEREAA